MQPPTNPLDGINLNPGRVSEIRAQERERRSFREEDDFGIKQEGGILQSKSNERNGFDKKYLLKDTKNIKKYHIIRIGRM